MPVILIISISRKIQEKKSFNFIPVVHIKNICKSFGYKDYRNNNGNSPANSNVPGKQQQVLKNARTTSLYRVLNSVELRIMEREFVTIVGPSGCRKSTLLNIIAGLDRPDSASVLVRGAVVGNNALSTKIVTIFQEGALFPWLNVRDNVEFGLKTAKMPKEIWHQIADKYRNGRLVKFSESFVYQLSGGMKQRVAISYALAMEPEVLLMDEPFASLDIQTRHLLHDELVDIHKTTGKTVLFVTHNIDEAILLGDGVIVLCSVLKNIKKEFRIDIQRPRDPESQGFCEIKEQTLREFEGDLSIAKKR